MGDRTYVQLTVLKEEFKAVKSINNHFTNDFSSEDGTHTLCYEEVNYGELDFLDELEDAGIAYDSRWESGDEYTSGVKHCRYTDTGEKVIKELYDDENGPPMKKLLELLESPEKLIAYILAYQESRSVLPWNNQLQNSKIFKAKKLIMPDY